MFFICHFDITKSLLLSLGLSLSVGPDQLRRFPNKDAA